MASSQQHSNLTQSMQTQTDLEDKMFQKMAQHINVQFASLNHKMTMLSSRMDRVENTSSLVVEFLGAEQTNRHKSYQGAEQARNMRLHDKTFTIETLLRETARKVTSIGEELERSIRLIKKLRFDEVDGTQIQRLPKPQNSDGQQTSQMSPSKMTPRQKEDHVRSMIQNIEMKF